MHPELRADPQPHTTTRHRRVKHLRMQSRSLFTLYWNEDTHRNWAGPRCRAKYLRDCFYGRGKRNNSSSQIANRSTPGSW
eukprot:scaffold1314_cov158-Amphora_coffeaeformis.AAC.14